MFKKKKANPKVTKEMVEQEYATKIATNHIAIIIDNVIEDIIHVDDRIALMLTSSPRFAKLDEGYSERLGDTYEK